MKRTVVSAALIGGLAVLAPATSQAADNGKPSVVPCKRWQQNGATGAHGRTGHQWSLLVRLHKANSNSWWFDKKSNGKAPACANAVVQPTSTRTVPGISPVSSTYTRGNAGSLTSPTPAGSGTCVLIRTYGDMGLYKCTTSGSLIARYYWWPLP